METGRISSLPQPSPAGRRSAEPAVARPAATTPPAAQNFAPPIAPPERRADGLAAESRRIEQEAESSRQSVEQLVERISQEIQIDRRSLSFQVNDDIGKTIVSVIDRETEEVIRQIPSEEVVRLARAIKEINDQRTVDSNAFDGAGLLLNEKA